jgi:bis(5'-nucleosidyl)-tetraphosphatase
MDEKSCGIVLFREDGQRLYLLLHYEEGHWDFPKGHVEEGESEHETAARETVEETGIADLDFITGFRERTEYSYKREGRLMRKEVFYFLARTGGEVVELSDEHTGFEWLPYEEALGRITYENSREILRKAERALGRP